jgi:hypothetical protein
MDVTVTAVALGHIAGVNTVSTSHLTGELQ